MGDQEISMRTASTNSQNSRPASQLSQWKRPKVSRDQPIRSIEFLKDNNAQRCFLRAKVRPDDLDLMIKKQKVFSLGNMPEEPFPCARLIPYEGCARARFWKFGRRKATCPKEADHGTNQTNKIVEKTAEVQQKLGSLQETLPKLCAIRQYASNCIVNLMMREQMRLCRLDLHRMTKQCRTDTRASLIASRMKRPFDGLEDNEPRTAETRDMRVAVGNEVVSLEISGPEQGVDVDWNMVWLEGIVLTEDESSSDSQSLALEEVSAEEVSRDSVYSRKQSTKANVFSHSKKTEALKNLSIKPIENEGQQRNLDHSDRLAQSKLKLQEAETTCYRVRGQRRGTEPINQKPNPLVFSVPMGFPRNVPPPVSKVVPTPPAPQPCLSPLDTLALAACSAAASAEASTAGSSAPSPAVQTENLGELIEKALKVGERPSSMEKAHANFGLLAIANVRRDSAGDLNRKEKQGRLLTKTLPSRNQENCSGNYAPSPVMQGQLFWKTNERQQLARSKSRSSTGSPKVPVLSQKSGRSPDIPVKESPQLTKRVLEILKKSGEQAIEPTSFQRMKGSVGLLQAEDWSQLGLEPESESPPPTEPWRIPPVTKTKILKSVVSPKGNGKKETKVPNQSHNSSKLTFKQWEQEKMFVLEVQTGPESFQRSVVKNPELSPTRSPYIYRTLTPEENKSPLSLVQKRMELGKALKNAAKNSFVNLKLPKLFVSQSPKQQSPTTKTNKAQPAGTVTQRINLDEFPPVSAKKRGRPRKSQPALEEPPNKKPADAILSVPEAARLSPPAEKGIYTAAAEEKHLPLKKRKVSYNADPDQEPHRAEPSPKKGRGRPPKASTRLENIPGPSTSQEDPEKKTKIPMKKISTEAPLKNGDVWNIADSVPPPMEESPRGRTRKSGTVKSPERMRRNGIRSRAEEMPAPTVAERLTPTPDSVDLSSTAGLSRSSSVADDSASERTAFSSYANMKTDNKYMMAPKKYLLRRAQTEQATEPVSVGQEPAIPLSVNHPAVLRQPSQDDVRFLTPPPPETSPDIVILEPEGKTPEEIKREAEELFEDPVPLQITDYEYDEGVDDPPLGAPLIYACDFTSIDKGSGRLNLDWAPFPPDTARVDAGCFSHLVLNLARGQKFSILPRMTNRYSLIRDEYDLLMFIIEDAEVNPTYLKGETYTLACEDPKALFTQAVNAVSKPAMLLLTRDRNPVLAKRQVLTSHKIREVIDVFLKRKKEMLTGLAMEAFGKQTGPEFELLQGQFELVMKAIQIRMCDNLMGLAEETRHWDPTVNTHKRRFETFLFGWRSFIHQGGPIKCFYERFKDEMHPRVAETMNKWISITETFTRKIASFLQAGPVARVHQLMEHFEKDRKVFTDKFQRSLLNVETTRSASHRHGCRDQCHIFFSEVDLFDYHTELHNYKPHECSVCYLAFSHEVSLILHYLERHTIDVLTGEIRIVS